MLTSAEIPQSFTEAIQQMPTIKRVMCRHCKHEAPIPILWDTWWCERCGTQSTLNMAGMIHGLARAALVWAGLDPDLIGLSLGDPKRISPTIVERITQTFGRTLLFMSLKQHFHWECQHSGHCCSDVVKYSCDSAGRLSATESLALCGRDDQSRLPSKGDPPVCGYREGGRCTAYSVRPSFCRAFPLGILSVEVGPKRVHYIVAAGVACPGLGKGPVRLVKDYLKEVGVLQRLVATNTDGFTQSY